MSLIDKRRPPRQIAQWQSGTPDEYRIELEQLGHEMWRMTEWDGINVVRVEDFTDPDKGQITWLEAQRSYLDVLSQFTLRPLPKKPSEIITISVEGE
jgi:hypothetical protein